MKRKLPWAHSNFKYVTVKLMNQDIYMLQY